MKHYRLPLSPDDEAALYDHAAAINVTVPAMLRGVIRGGPLTEAQIAAAHAANEEAHAALSTRKKKDAGP